MKDYVMFRNIFQVKLIKFIAGEYPPVYKSCKMSDFILILYLLLSLLRCFCPLTNFYKFVSEHLLSTNRQTG